MDTHGYIVSGSKVIAEYANGSLSKEYVYAGSTLLATHTGSATTYSYPDHLSTRVEADANGAVTRTFGHYPFGEAWYETGTASKWKFTSYERDAESGLDQAIYRYDSSRLGRFMSPDRLAGQISNPQSLNRYSYVGNDPVNRIDPLGRAWCLFRQTIDADTGTVVYERLLFCVPDWGFGPLTFGLGAGIGGGGGEGAKEKADINREDLLRRLLNPECNKLFGGLANALDAFFRTQYFDYNKGEQGELYQRAQAYFSDPKTNPQTVAVTPFATLNGALVTSETYLRSGFYKQDFQSQQIVLLHELRHPALQKGRDLDQDYEKEYQTIEESCPPQEVQQAPVSGEVPKK